MPIAPTLYMKQFSGSHTKWQWSPLRTCYSIRPAHYFVAGRSFPPSRDHDSWSCTVTKLGESPVSLHPWRKGRRIVQCLASPLPGPTNLAGSMMRSSLVVYAGKGQNVLMLQNHRLYKYIYMMHLQRSLTLQCLKLGSGFGDWLQGLKIQNALSKEHELKQDAATSYRTSPPKPPHTVSSQNHSYVTCCSPHPLGLSATHGLPAFEWNSSSGSLLTKCPELLQSHSWA